MSLHTSKQPRLRCLGAQANPCRIPSMRVENAHRVPHARIYTKFDRLSSERPKGGRRIRRKSHRVAGPCLHQLFRTLGQPSARLQMQTAWRPSRSASLCAGRASWPHTSPGVLRHFQKAPHPERPSSRADRLRFPRGIRRVPCTDSTRLHDLLPVLWTSGWSEMTDRDWGNPAATWSSRLERHTYICQATGRLTSCTPGRRVPKGIEAPSLVFHQHRGGMSKPPLSLGRWPLPQG